MASLLPPCLALLLVSAGVHGQGNAVEPSHFGPSCAGTSSDQIRCRALLQNISSASPAGTIGALCNHIETWIASQVCIIGVMQACVPAEYRGLIQTADRARDALQYLCDHKTGINAACVAQSASSDSCSSNAVNSFQSAVSESGLVESTCSMLNTLAGCYRRIGASCPSHSVDLYDTFLKKSYPPACGASGLSVPTSFLILGACAVLLNKMAAVF